MKKNCSSLVRWKLPDSIVSFIVVDFVGSLSFFINYSLNWPAFILLPTAPLGSFELWLATLSVLHKNVLFYIFAILFLSIKPIIALCIFKNLQKMNFFAIGVYVIELFSAMYFVFDFRIVQDDVNIFFLVLECAFMVWDLIIIGFAVKNFKHLAERQSGDDNQGAVL